MLKDSFTLCDAIPRNVKYFTIEFLTRTILRSISKTKYLNMTKVYLVHGSPHVISVGQTSFKLLFATLKLIS